MSDKEPLWICLFLVLCILALAIFMGLFDNYLAGSLTTQSKFDLNVGDTVFFVPDNKSRIVPVTIQGFYYNDVKTELGMFHWSCIFKTHEEAQDYIDRMSRR